MLASALLWKLGDPGRSKREEKDCLSNVFFHAKFTEKREAIDIVRETGGKPGI